MRKIRKHIKRHHIHLGGWVFIGSLSVIFISVLWSLNIINLPPSLVYYSRQLSGKISTRPGPTLTLNLKFHRQEHSLSCEAAALKMVLDYHGFEATESEVISKIPVDPTVRSGNIWGDPHMGFVGDIDGKMMVNGYGVHWEPLALAASNWKEVKIIKNGSAQDLTAHIQEGRPIVVWGYLGRGKPVSWQTPEGKKIYGVNGEHTRVVYGFWGTAENPEGFFVMDPTYGPAYWKRDIFMRNWDGLGRMGLVVYP